MSETHVLVTGGAGYIGSFAVRALQRAGFHPVIVDNLCTGFRETVPEGASFFQTDVRDVEAVCKILREFKISSVMHFAAHLIVPDSLANPLDYYENNFVGTLKLLRACAAEGVTKFIFSSSAAVYGNTNHAFVKETDPLAPESPYGWSKLMSEQLIQDFQNAQPNFASVLFRYFNVAGASSDGSLGSMSTDATHLLKVACEAAVGRKPHVSIFGSDYSTPDGTCIRDFIHVEDLVQAHVSGLKYLINGGASEIFNLGYGHGYSVKEVLKSMQKVAGREFPIEIVNRRKGDLMAVVADVSKVKKTLSWSPKYDDLNQICRTALEWERHLPGKS